MTDYPLAPDHTSSQRALTMQDARREQFAPGVFRHLSITLGVTIEAPLEVRRRLLWHVRIVQLLDRDREACVRAVDARAPVRRVRARGEHRLRPAPILANEAAHVAHAVRREEQPVGPLTEQQILPTDLRARIGQPRE